MLNSDYIEFLFNPIEKLVAIRASEEGLPGALCWSKLNNGKRIPISVGCSAFTTKLYELMQWPKLWNTMVLSMTYQKEGECVLIFDLSQTEINALQYERPKPPKTSRENDVFYNVEAMIAQQLELLHAKQDRDLVLEEEETKVELPPPKRKKLHPRDWAFNFGMDSKDAATNCRRYQFETLHEWNISASGTRIAEFDSSVTINRDDIQEQILKLISANTGSKEEE